MIEKNRLEELIYNEQTIWVVYDEERIEHIKLITKMFGVSVDEYNKINKCEPMLYSNFCGVFKDICLLKDCFETKEDAEEYAEFGNITRTEKLELPSWEEMQDKLNKEEFVEKYYFYSKHFYKANRETINIDYTYSIYLMPNGLIIIDDNEKPKTLFSKPLTRENYNEARRLCVKLFKGEEV